MRNFAHALWRVLFMFAGALVFVAYWQGLGAEQGEKELWPEERPISPHDRELTKRMLTEVHRQLKASYYDPTFRGMDVDARFQTYLQQLERAGSLGKSFLIINEFLSGIGDGHSFFVPPGAGYRYDSGYRMAMIGEQCFITGVRPGSDAERKLHPGDQVLSVDGQTLKRRDFWGLNYAFRVLAPAPVTDLALRGAGGVSRREGVVTRRRMLGGAGLVTNKHGCGDCFAYAVGFEEMQLLLRSLTVENGDVILWKMPRFHEDGAALYALMGRARRHKALILDLRDNPGVPEDVLKTLGAGLNTWFLPASVESPGGLFPQLRFMVGSLFDHDVRIGRKTTRGKGEDIVARSHGRGGFTGQLFVLVNSGTAFDAEVFARLVQLENRGTIVGDLTAGSVMNSRCEELFLFNPVSFSEACIADGEIVMADGTSLEGVGVTPDVLVLPAAADLAAARDPVLARAAELAGAKLDPAAAGKMFPLGWAP